MRPEEEMEHEMCSQHAGQLQARIEELEQADRIKTGELNVLVQENRSLQAQLAAVTQERDTALEAKTKLRDLHMSIIGAVREELAQLQAHNKAMRDALEMARPYVYGKMGFAQRAIQEIDAALTLTQEKPGG